jgi:hypothetical protein
VGSLHVRVLRFSPWIGLDFSSRENPRDNIFGVVVEDKVHSLGIRSLATTKLGE